MLVKQRLEDSLLALLLVATLSLVVDSNVIDIMTDSGSGGFNGNNKCEPLNTDLLPICKDLPYNETQFPNFMKQRSQLEASRDTDVYLPFIRINCSPVLKLFLCSLYAPPCIRNYSSGLIRPCREMCERAKSGCDVFMQRYQFTWPDYMDCSRFPSFNGPEVCVNDDYSMMSGQQLKQSPSFSTSNGLGFSVSQPASPQKLDNNFLANLTPQQQQLLLNSLTSVNNLPGALDVQKLYAAALAAAAIAAVSPTTMSPQFRDSQLGFTPAAPRIKFICPPVLQLLTDTKSTYYLQVPISSATSLASTSNSDDMNTMNCGMPCDNHIYDKSEVQFARTWVLIWSSLCFASTLFTILTFVIEPSRFHYPQKPIIFLSGCYMIVSLAYMIGSSSSSTAGNTVLCRTQKNAHMQSKEYLVQGLEQIQCTLLFMMIYYFGMSAAIWWVILTFTWLLAAALKWAHEGIEKYACYFHIAAWGLPCGQMIIALWMQKVDADVLSGVCYTGIRDMNSLRGFVLAPFIIYLILGFMFLIVGFVSLYRIKNKMKMEGNRTAKLEQFVMRLFTFSIIYMLLAVVFVMCLFNEMNKYGSWIEQWLRRNSVEFNLPPDYVANSLTSPSASNNFDGGHVYWLDYWMLMGKYASVLMIGIVSGFWIWTTKTFISWLRFFDRVFSVWLDVFKVKFKKEAAV